MKYYTFKYEIKFKDGTGEYGEVPYRGNSANLEDFIRHIRMFFGGMKAYEDTDIIIADVKEFKNGEEWIDGVHLWQSFKHLSIVQNYAGELLLAHYPNELPKLG